MQITFSLLFSIVVCFILLCCFLFFDVNPLRYIQKVYVSTLNKIARLNVRRAVKNIKRGKIEKEKKNVITSYHNLAREMIADYNLPLTMEGFNTFVSILFSILALLVFIFLRSFTMSFLVAVSMIVAGFTYFIMQARVAESKKIEAIMDAEDLICPLAKEGVLVAIKKVLENKEYLSPFIRPYFVQFLDNCENHGYSFKNAMEILNRQLGPKFDNFAKKAIIFEYNERKGMADIFLDIVDENAALREINIRKNIVFKRMNREFLMKTLLISLFVLYSFTGEAYRQFMTGSEMGRFMHGFSIIAICLSFARCQMLQRDISFKNK